MTAMYRFLFLTTIMPLCWVASLQTANAQLIPDNSLGTERSVVTPNVDIRGIPSNRIDGGAVRNSNLFHSFQEFNVEAGRGVYFSNPDNIVNILTRVTGDNLSNIFGTLGVLGNANLYLINPNGIVFGPNARLDVGGSFFASTADSILFNNGIEFAATNPEAPPLLTINIPLGLNFRENPGNIPGNITVEGEGHNFQVDPNQSANIITENRTEGLQVPSNQTLAFVGGDIAMTGGNLIAETGRIELASVQAGEVRLPTAMNPGFNYQNVTLFGNIQLSEAASVDVLGVGGGIINVQGQSVSLTEGSVIIADTLGTLPSGGLTVSAVDILELIGTSPQQVPSGLFANVGRNATAPGGTLTVNTPNLILNQGAKIAADTFSDQREGIGGTLTVNSQYITLEDHSQISTGTFGNANAGILTINTQNINIQNGSRILANSLGNATGGELMINAESIILQDETAVDNSQNEMMPPQNNRQQTARIAAESQNNGDAGNITINTNRLIVENGSIRAGTDFEGDAGSLTITANNITITGSSGLFAQTNGAGDAGKLTLNTQQLTVRDGGRVSTRTRGSGNAGVLDINTNRLILENRGDIRVSTEAEGNGGNLTITASDISITGEGSGLFADANGTGDAGELTLNTQQLTLRDGGRISTRTTGMGNAGVLEIKTNRLSIEGGDIRAGTEGAGNGGNLTITANEITITGTDTERRSGLFADVRSQGTGNGGTVTITTQNLNLSNDAEIRAGTRNIGDAGNLIINAQNIQVQDGAEISTDTQGEASGDAGTLTINAENITVEETTQTATPPPATARIVAETDGSGNSGTVTINTQNLTVQNGGRVSSRTRGTGNAGTLDINTHHLIVEGGEIQADTTGAGNAGNVNVTANNIELIGTEIEGQLSGLFADVRPTATGNGGTVTLDTQNLTVRNGGEIRVQSQGGGTPGSINIRASDIRLDRQGRFSARSETGQGGNIRLQADDIRLRRQSEIEASGSERNPTLDGNITIDTNLLVLLEESRITTNAFNPAGGSNITIRPLGGSNLTIIQSQNSIINAAGNLTIDTTLSFAPPDVLEVEVVNPEALIAQNPCQQGNESEFIITGRGGLPPNPTQGTRNRNVSVNLAEPVLETPSQRTENRTDAVRERPIPARGWIRNEKGEVILVSYDPTRKQPQRRRQYFPNCSQP